MATPEVSSPTRHLGSSGEFPEFTRPGTPPYIPSPPRPEKAFEATAPMMVSSAIERVSRAQLVPAVETTEESYPPFPECLPAVFRDLELLVETCAPFATPISAWPKELPGWRGLVDAFDQQHIKFRKVGYNPRRFWNEIDEFEYNQVTKPVIAGSYVWVGPKLWIMHQKPTYARGTAFAAIASAIRHKSHIICLASTDDPCTAKQCVNYWDSASVYKGFETLMEIEGGQALIKRRFLTEDGFEFFQLHLDHWHDRGVEPNLDFLMRLFEEIDALGHENPIHMHCAAGINRTGSVAILYEVYSQLKTEPDPVINIPEMILKMRLQRPSVCYKAYQWLHKLIPLIATRMRE